MNKNITLKYHRFKIYNRMKFKITYNNNKWKKLI